MCRILAGFVQIITDLNTVVPKITSVVDLWHFGTDPDPRICYPTLGQEGQADLKNDVEVVMCCGWTPGRQPSHPRIYATGSPVPNAIWNEKLTSKRVESVPVGTYILRIQENLSTYYVNGYRYPKALLFFIRNLCATISVVDLILFVSDP